MIDKIAVLIPTRKRLIDFKIFANSWVKTTTGYSEVIVSVDTNDDTYDELITSNKYPFIWERGESKPCLHILNDLAIKYAKMYNYVAFMEDDTLFNTPNWELPIINKLKELGKTGIVWGNDLISGAKHIGLPFMRSEIVNTLGYMCPLKFKSQGPDGYWTDLGKKLNTIHYFPEIITEHRHFTTGKRIKDNTAWKIESECMSDRLYLASKEFIDKVEHDYKILSKINNI